MQKPLSGRTAVEGSAPVETFQSIPTTRIVRLSADTGGEHLVTKEYFGADAARRCSHEADILNRLFHVAGVPKLDAKVAANALTLHNCVGVRLAQVLQGRVFPPAELVAFAWHLARILGAVHAAGVVHRNINPQAILQSAAGLPLLVDFELAGVADQPADDSLADEMAGALAYFAPEQTGRTGRPVDSRSDLYSLGATLYHMAVGRAPFEAQDKLQLIHDVLVREVPAPAQLVPGIPQGLSDVIMHLLVKAPAGRYQSAEGLVYDLSRLRDNFEHGHASAFALGQRDFPARLAAPQGVIARNEERLALRTAFDLAMNSTRHTLLVEGTAGVGKTALVDELRAIVAKPGGWFVRGKFDQYQTSSTTTGALAQALRQIGRLLLALPQEELAQQRRVIMERVGSGAGLITRLLPEFALLLGPQPEAPEVDLRQAELQLQEATISLLQAVASRERPLVVALDDLQWAAGPHLRAFERLMMDSSLEGLLLVGAYRGDEASAHETLAPMVEQWRENGAPLTHVPLENLDCASLVKLVEVLLRLGHEQAAALATELHALTSGNPLDTLELINALRRDGVIRLGESGWTWREAAIRRYVGRGNVVDLLAVRIARLPARSHELLECMSCLGNTVDVRLLAAALGVPEADVPDLLMAACDDGLLTEVKNDMQWTVAFRHDRVQQAVMGSMHGELRLHRRLELARRLAHARDFDDYAAAQYLECVASLQSDAERLTAAGLLLAAGDALAATADYVLAERYLEAANGLVAAVSKEATADAASIAALQDAINTVRHAVLYPLGRLDEADRLFEVLHASTADPLDLVDATCRQMRSLDVRGRMADAVVLGLQMLGRLGLHAPQDALSAQTHARLDALQQWVHQDALLDPASRPQIRDRRTLAIAKLLGRTVRSALVRFDTKAIVWLLLESHRLWVEHGPCPELVANLGRMSAMLIALRNNYPAAYDYARHILRVSEALGYEPQCSEARFVFVTYAAHWFEPLESVFKDGKQAYEVIRSRGDPSYACFVHMNMLLTQLEMAPTIEICVLEVEAGIALCQRTGNRLAQMHHMCDRQLLRALRGQTRAANSFDDAQFDERTMLPLIETLPNLEQTYRACRALNGLLMGDADVLIPNAVRAVAVINSIPGYYLTMYVFLGGAVAHAWDFRRARARGDADTSAIEAGMAQCRDWLGQRAAAQPHNLLHLLHFVDAEQAWAAGDMARASAAFDAALLEAQTRERPWHRALITERAGLFQLETGLTYTGRKLLAEARDRYTAWGATAKAAQMERDHSPLVAGLPTHAAADVRSAVAGDAAAPAAPESLDLLGVLRASQALSSERSLNRLIARVTEVLETLSGATRVSVLSWSDGQWWLLGKQDTAPLPAPVAAGHGLLPISAVTYVDRTGETVLLDDACSDDRFARDTYFNGVLMCSLLVMPIAGQGDSRAMLILENRHDRAAFRAQRLDAVMLIAGQLAVSLANAQLYDGLEERVRSRTRELEQMQARLVTTARSAGRAEIANNVLHNVGNVLNSINVSASAVRQALAQSKSGKLADAVGLLKEHRHDLNRFFESDPRGQVLLPYLDGVIGTLELERREVVHDLDRLMLSVDHITNILATQQSHSGPSSIVEHVQPADILGEALAMCSQLLLQSSVTVATTRDATPALAFDKQRVLQILVNLIRNAVEAMANTPPAARHLELVCTLIDASAASSDGLERLRIAVRDTGEGIAPANLARLFAHGFTTRIGGHGFGLHSSAVAAMEMGGRLTAHSDGEMLGATFTLEFPTTRVSSGH